MGSSAIVVGDPGFEDKPKVGLAQRNQPAQAPPANRANSALANGIRLWAARRGLQYLDSERADRLVEMFCKNTIAIMNQKFVSHSIPDRLTQLLQAPVGTRMSCNVAMDQASVAVLDHHEHVQQAKRCGHRDKEIAGNDSLGVQSEKG